LTLERKVFGVGYVGKGKYKHITNGKHTKQYTVWHSMIRRCYSEVYLKNKPSYIGCKVVEQWHNFQNFAEWYDKNYYEIEGETMCLDKDILVKGNRIYSPETCVFVSRSINSMFTKTDSKRGKYPIGVKWHSRDEIFEAKCCDGTKKHIYLGRFKTPEEAFQVYKTYKESLIKRTAIKFKDQIPSKLYNALMNYEVEITD
jgi:hypothetical protein